MATNLNIIHYVSIFYIAFFAKSIKKKLFFLWFKWHLQLKTSAIAGHWHRYCLSLIAKHLYLYIHKTNVAGFSCRHGTTPPFVQQVAQESRTYTKKNVNFATYFGQNRLACKSNYP